MVGFFVVLLGLLVMVAAAWALKRKNEHWNRYRAINQTDAFKMDETSDDELFNIDADQLEFEDEPAFDDNYSFYSSAIVSTAPDLSLDHSDTHLREIRAEALTAGLDDSLGESNFDAEAWDRELASIQTGLDS